MVFIFGYVVELFVRLVRISIVVFNLENFWFSRFYVCILKEFLGDVDVVSIEIIFWELSVERKGDFKIFLNDIE